MYKNIPSYVDAALGPNIEIINNMINFGPVHLRGADH